MAPPLLIPDPENATIEELKQHGFNNYVCKSEEKLLERLDQPILDLIDNPEKTQQTTAIGTLF